MFKKEKPRVYLGNLAVAPRTDIKKDFDQWGLLKTKDLDTEIRKSLKDIFVLPSIHEIKEPKNNDLGLDIIIPKFQAGDSLNMSLGDIDIPFMWRPKITVSSRLYNLKTEKTKAIFSVNEKMKWGEYFSRLFTFRVIFRFRPLFDSNDMEYLLNKAI